MNKNNLLARKYALDFALFCLLAAILSLFLILPMMLGFGERRTSGKIDSPYTVVIDAGHGGEDGGAVGNGLVEKDVNLDISLKITKILESRGINVVLTRDKDILLYDVNSDYKGQKKSQDLRKRLEITNSIEHPIFVSVHMNAFPQTQYGGLQVYYSKNHIGSKNLATLIQSRVKSELQTSNNRACKEATSKIFLLHNLYCPAILIECGFLSNKQDAAALSNEDYKEKLANSISLSIMEYISKNNP